jgi:tetratricopeptide (TPR) repeat protein
MVAVLRRFGGVFPMIAGLALAPCAALAAAPATPAEALDQITALARARHCDQALALLASPAVAGLIDTATDPQKITADQIGMVCAQQTAQPTLALKYASAGTALPDAPVQLWGGRLALEWATGDHARAIASLESIGALSPGVLNQIDADWLAFVYRSLQAQGEDALRQRLVKRLAAPDYVPADIGRSADGYRYEYAGMQAQAGDMAGAGATFAAIDTPSLLMRATLDPRLRAQVPPGFDALAAVRLRQQRFRAIVAAWPGMVAPALALADTYANLDDGQGMLAVLEPVRPGKDHPALVATRGDVYRWWHALEEAYTLLGRYDDALAAIRQSMAAGEVNAGNASELLQLGALHLRFGHPAEALTAMAPLAGTAGGLSTERETFLRKLRGCAAFMTGKAEVAEADLAWLRAHRRENPGNFFALLLCMRHDDEAAAIAIGDLADPDKRAVRLLAFSSFAALPATYPPDWYRDGVARLATRADVQAAVAKAGGAGHFNIPPL